MANAQSIQADIVGPLTGADIVVRQRPHLFALTVFLAPDGERFLMVKTGDEEDGGRELIVVQNWSEELNRLVPTN